MIVRGDWAQKASWLVAWDAFVCWGLACSAHNINPTSINDEISPLRLKRDRESYRELGKKE